MMLTERAPQLPKVTMLAHRRAPSAPVVVAPTKVPGLLTMSKPAARSPPKNQQPRQRSPKSSKADKPVSNKSSTIEQSPDQPADKSPRGRQAASKSPKPSRSSSNTPPAPQRRTVGASTPQLNASPAEAIAAAPTGRPRRTPGRAASFQGPPAHEPFFAPVPPTDATKTAPQLSPRPSGKLARRRRQAPESPTLTRAVPVSRSDVPSRAMSRSVPKSMDYGRPTFPICDDLSDSEDSSIVFPVTPVRKAPVVKFDNGPRTAPMFGAASPSTPISGVFDMSSDEDLSTPTDEKAQIMWGLGPATSPTTLAREKQAAAHEQMLIKFANSVFQNSPDPDDIPVPMF
jgi:hypothetical protein